MRVINVLAAVAAIMIAGGGAAAKEKPADSGEKKICRTEAAAAVGRLPAKRVCRTKAEWDSASASGQRKSVRASSGASN